MRNLINIFNSKPTDLRYLLDVDELPEDYNTEELVPVFDDILREDQKLRGDRYYDSFIEESDYTLNQKIRITQYEMAIMCKELFLHEDAQIILDGIKSKAKTLQDIKRERSQRMRKLHIQLMHQEAGKSNNEVSFGGLIANMNYILKMEIKNPTVSEYRKYEEIMKANIAAQTPKK